MLVDYISPSKLPWIIVWLDWNFYAYWPSLIVSVGISTVHYWISRSHHSFYDFDLVLFVGFCLWVIWCVVRQGYAVG